jgi:hypothetical protein
MAEINQLPEAFQGLAKKYWALRALDLGDR